MPKWAFLRESVHYLYLFVDSLIEPLPTPGMPRVVSHREVYTKMSKQMGYTVGHPELPTPNDVVKVRLYATVDGTASAPVDLAPGDTYEVVTNPGAKVEVTFTSLDDTNNESAHSPALDFAAIDDIPPPVPGAPTVLSHREILTPDTPPPVTPTPPTPPTTDPNVPPVVPAPAPSGQTDNLYPPRNA
jgi:hypothetical protein